MKGSIIIFITLFALFLWAYQDDRKFVTTIDFQQTYSGGFVDTAQAVILTTDSLFIVYYFDPPTRYFPTGGWCIAGKVGAASEDRYYANPQVVKIKPFRVSSVRRR